MMKVPCFSSTMPLNKWERMGRLSSFLTYREGLLTRELHRFWWRTMMTSGHSFFEHSLKRDVNFFFSNSRQMNKNEIHFIIIIIITMAFSSHLWWHIFTPFKSDVELGSTVFQQHHTSLLDYLVFNTFCRLYLLTVCCLICIEWHFFRFW